VGIESDVFAIGRGSCRTVGRRPERETNISFSLEKPIGVAREARIISDKA